MQKGTNTNRRVLLIDDEPFVIEMLAAELKELGIEFLSASDGNSALAIIEKEKPAVIVSDYKMPGLDGIELLRFLRNLNYNVPVIWITGNADDETRKEAWKLGVFHLFQKPFDPESVARQILTALGVGQEFWQEIQPTFFTETVLSKTHKKVLLELESALYQKCKEHCLKNSISLNSFVRDLVLAAVKQQ